MPVKKKAAKKAAAKTATSKTAAPAKKTAKKATAAAGPKKARKKAVRKPKTAVVAAAPSAEDIRQQIELLAYQLWEERGRPEGSGHEDWVRAEELVRSKLG